MIALFKEGIMLGTDETKELAAVGLGNTTKCIQYTNGCR